MVGGEVQKPIIIPSGFHCFHELYDNHSNINPLYQIIF